MSMDEWNKPVDEIVNTDNKQNILKSCIKFKGWCTMSVGLPPCTAQIGNCTLTGAFIESYMYLFSVNGNPYLYILQPYNSL